MYKFRTMTNKKDKDGNLLLDEKRLTKFGKILRKTSLDEIPEFINILKGDMSFVGPRPLLVEFQALTTGSVYGLPRRTANGIDYNRLTLLIAVLEKKSGLLLGNQDVYLNVVGGLKINEPAIDLGILLATASSFKNIPIPRNVVALGEVGLTGEVRAINLIDKRLKEAEKLGFKTCIIPESNKKLLKDNYKLDIIGVKNINEAMKVAFGI